MTTSRPSIIAGRCGALPLLLTLAGRLFADVVARAAIHGLNPKVEEKDARITALEKELSELKHRVAENTELKQELCELKQLVSSLADKLNGGAK